MPKVESRNFYRIIDANFNRSKEGLRVCEDICRFIYNDERLTSKFKILRHRLTTIISLLKIPALIQARDVRGDIGQGSYHLELKRGEVEDIFYANSQRVKESVRVLEEFAKLLNRHMAEKLKSLRYQMYALEKEVTKRH